MMKGNQPCKRRGISKKESYFKLENKGADASNGICCVNSSQENGKILKYMVVMSKKPLIKSENIPDPSCESENYEKMQNAAPFAKSDKFILDQNCKTEVINTSEEHSTVEKSVRVMRDHSSSTSSAISKLAISPTCGSVQAAKQCISKSSDTKKLGSSAQSQLTSFYQMRRSNRKRRSMILKEQQELMEQKILSAVEDGLQVINIIGKGRGVIATKEFKRGDFVVEYSGELIDFGVAKKRDAEYARDRRIGCYMYYFVHKDHKYCVDATEETGKFGRLINHSKTGNLTTKTIVINSVPRLILLANRDILPGQELSYDYGDRNKESVKAHPWLAT